MPSWYVELALTSYSRVRSREKYTTQLIPFIYKARGNAQEVTGATEEDTLPFSTVPAEVGITDLGTQFKFMGLIEAGIFTL